MKKIPKWQTDKEWALRRARRRKERLPEDVEKLFIGEEEHILSYTGVLSSINQSTPDFLERSFIDQIKTLTDRRAASKILDYAFYGKGRLKNLELENVLYDMVSKVISSPYEWGTTILLRYASLCGKDFPEKMENLFWGSAQCALSYSTQHGKRIPEKYEVNCLKHLDSDDFVTYATKIFNGRMPENLEELIISRPELAFDYAEQVVKGILPEKIHNALILRSFENEYKESIRDYMDFVEKVHSYTRSVLAHFSNETAVGEVARLIGEKNER